MRPESEAAFERVMIQFGDVYGRPIKGQLLEWYRMAVEVYSAPVIDAAAAKWILDPGSVKAPPPGRLRELCKEARETHRSEPRALPEPAPTYSPERDDWAEAHLAKLKRLSARIGRGDESGWGPDDDRPWLTALERRCPVLFGQVYGTVDQAMGEYEAERTERTRTRATSRAGFVERGERVPAWLSR
jgi:hypothetical protein